MHSIETLFVPCVDCEHRYLAVPDNILSNAAQEEVRQPRPTMGTHDDHLTVQFQSDVHDHRARRSLTNDDLGIGHRRLQLAHGFMSVLPEQRKGIKTSRYGSDLRQAEDINDMEQKQLCPEHVGNKPCPFQRFPSVRGKVCRYENSRNLGQFPPCRFFRAHSLTLAFLKPYLS